MSSLIRSAPLTGLIGCLVFVCFGCGGGRPKTYPVTGKVTWNGELLREATVAFVPVEEGNSFPASGITDSDGNFKLTTFKTDDGALPGEYRVSVSAMEGADPATKNEGTRLLPDKYYRANTSELTATVEARGPPQVIDFELEGERAN